MNPNAPKENANPTIRSVEIERSHSRRTPVEWSHMGTFTRADKDNTNNDNDAIWIPHSSEDCAIMKAILDISRQTHGKGVSLLTRAGLTLPATITPGRGGETGSSSIIGTTLLSPSIHFEEEEERKDEKDSMMMMKDIVVKRDRIDAEEVFDIIRTIQDPEHPNTLEQLAVVSLEQVEVQDEDDPPNTTESQSLSLSSSTVNVRFTPTIPHCSMATLIGLCLTVKLMRSLPPRFKIQVQIEPGTHASEKAINKQLRDKERVCAALENKHLAGVVNKCIQQGAESHGG